MTDTSTTSTAPTPTATTHAVVSLPTDQSGATLSLPSEHATTPTPTLSSAPSALDRVVGFYEKVFSTTPGETPAQKAVIAAIIERSFAKGYTYNGQPFVYTSALSQEVELEFNPPAVQASQRGQTGRSRELPRIRERLFRRYKTLGQARLF